MFELKVSDLWGNSNNNAAIYDIDCIDTCSACSIRLFVFYLHELLQLISYRSLFII